MDESQTWHAVQPEGLALLIVVITIIFTVLNLVVLLLRGYTRTINHSNGIEDHLMYIGGIVNLGHNIAVVYGCYTGIGSSDYKLNAPIVTEGAKMVTIWQLLYLTCSPIIKISICATLIRLASQRRYTYPLYAVSILATAMSVMGIICVFIQCTPFTASWTGKGKCIPVDVIMIPTYIFSAVNIAIDWTISIIPAFILWNLRIRRNLKLLGSGILGIGILASTATIVRMMYVLGYADNSNQLRLGILACSLPSLGELRGRSKDKSTRRRDSYGTELLSIGGKRSKPPPIVPTYDYEVTTTIGQGGDENSDTGFDKDDDSTRRMIYVTRVIQQTYS
ncbi:unnamed protein product [Clonostachys rosea f. rosea IK726]|uniref:Uncharacterized protein n=1 Tax=Clonostachys rosea f. rosea IK726 TaxID=1349383 RepID=A0ACA9TZV1_BIOOC|nr:unnamed protein product [Clonostachys rosea f. rosea IK726]